MADTQRVCRTCGASSGAEGGPLKRCGSCRLVYYCCREHQKVDWKSHKDTCKSAGNKESVQTAADAAATEAAAFHETGNHESVVVVEVESDEGFGLTNRMVDHLFASKADALRFIRGKLKVEGNANLQPLTDMPFLTRLLHFDGPELYVDPRRHTFLPSTHPFLRCFGGMPSGQRRKGDPRTLNGLAIYLGVKLDTGLTMHNNVKGTVFFIGKVKGKPVTASILWGVANFLCDAMDYYGSDDDSSLASTVFSRWANKYATNEWEPAGGTAGIDVYDAVPGNFADELGGFVDHTLRAYGPNVVFQEGPTWIENRIYTVMHDGTDAPPLPIELRKAWNTNNIGELGIYVLMSDHLGRDTLDNAVGARQMRPAYDSRPGSVWSYLTSPARQEELEAREEFVVKGDMLGRGFEDLMAQNVITKTERYRDVMGKKWWVCRALF